MTVRIVHKSSSASGKNPTGSQLANAEIAINYHADGPFISAKDTNGRVVRLGGVWMQENSPDDPTHMTFWVRLSTNQLFVYDANTSAWRGLTGTGGGGGGGGDITDVLGGDGITVINSAGPQPTVSVDIENNRGLEIDSGNLRGVIASTTNLGVVKAGAGVTIANDGTISAAGTPLTYKGVVDLTSATVPGSPSVGDVYANTGTGNANNAWANITGNLTNATATSPGDLIAYKGGGTPADVWTYVPTGGASPATNLDYTAAVNQGTVTSDTGTNAVIPLADGTNAGLFSAAEKTKLAGIETGAQDGTVTSITPGTGLENQAGNQNAITTAGTISLSNTAVAAGTYGDATNVAQFAVNAQGQITSATEVAINVGASLWSRAGATGIAPTTDGNDIFLTASSASAAADERIIFRGNATRDVSLSGPHTNLGASYNLKLPGDVVGNAPAVGDVIAIQAIAGTELTSQWISPGEMQPTNGDYGFWTRTDATDTLEPRTQGDDLLLKSQDSEFLVLQGTDDGAATRDIVLRAPSGLAGWGAGTTTYTFPSVPINGRFLSTNAAGTLSWNALPNALWEDNTVGGNVYLRPATDTNRLALREAGTAALPAIVHEGDENSGIGFSTADQVDISTNGVIRASAVNTGFVVPLDIQSTSQNGNQLAGRRNQIINGALEIWQRGVDGLLLSSGNVDYLADRWAVYKVANWALNDYQRSADAPAGLNYSARLNASNANIDFRQCIELERIGHAGRFVPGTTWTFSCYGKATNNQGDIRPTFAFADGLSDNGVSVFTGAAQNLTNQWQRFTWTFTIAGGVVPQGTHACLRFVLNVGSDPDARITGVQLEPGPR